VVYMKKQLEDGSESQEESEFQTLTMLKHWSPTSCLQKYEKNIFYFKTNPACSILLWQTKNMLSYDDDVSQFCGSETKQNNTSDFIGLYCLDIIDFSILIIKIYSIKFKPKTIIHC
jgi:hypothetical protein